MLNSSNYFLLISLAIVSWVLLCLSNSKPPYEKFVRKQQTIKNSAADIDSWPQTILYSVSSVNSGIMIYIACTLFGIFIIVNIVKRKLSALGLAEPLAAIEAKVVSLKHQVSRLRTEKGSLINLVRQYKVEKKFLVQHVTFNSAIIQRLKSDLKATKEQLDVFKCKFYTLFHDKSAEQCYDLVPNDNGIKSNDTNCISSAYIINQYFRCPTNDKCLKRCENYDSMRLTASNHDVINKILKEAYEKTGSIAMPHSKPKDILSILDTNEYLNVATNQKNSKIVKMQEEGVNIVSTHQLEILKGLSVKTDDFFADLHCRAK